jgi:hypothetical protein
MIWRTIIPECLDTVQSLQGGTFVVRGCRRWFQTLRITMELLVSSLETVSIPNTMIGSTIPVSRQQRLTSSHRATREADRRFRPGSR